MEGVSADDNEIYLELGPENLVKALKTAQMAKTVKIKLTKKHAPCLTVEVDLVIVKHSKHCSHLNRNFQLSTMELIAVRTRRNS